MADAAGIVALLLTRLREAHEILRDLSPSLPKRGPWLVTLRIYLFSFGVLHRRFQAGLSSLRDIEAALGLLIMLRHVNYEEYVAQVLEIWPAISREQLSSDGGTHETFGVEIYLHVDYGFAELQRCHEQRQAIGQSAAYQHVLQFVQALNQAQGEWQSPKVPVHLDLFRIDQSSFVSLLRETIKMYRSEDPAPVFSISPTYFTQWSLNLGVEELTEIAAFQDQGMVVYPRRLALCQLPQAQFRPQLLHVLHLLFGAPHQTQRIWYLTVSNSTPSYWIPALLSLAHSSKSLESIIVESTFAELRETKSLLWIAHAAFRRQHQPLQLTLNCSHIEPSDVEAIQRIITA